MLWHLWVDNTYLEIDGPEVERDVVEHFIGFVPKHANGPSCEDVNFISVTNGRGHDVVVLLEPSLHYSSD